MEDSKTVEITQGDFRLFYHRKIIGALKRISPRSYYAGERVGFVGGVALGFGLGVMFICFCFGVL